MEVKGRQEEDENSEDGNANILCCGVSKGMTLSLLILLIASNQVVVYLDFIITYFQMRTS